MDDARGLGRGGRAARGTHGQLRGRPPEPRGGPDGAAGPPAHRPRAPRTDPSSRTRPSLEAMEAAKQAGRGAAPDGPRLRRRRPLPRAPPLRPARDGAKARRPSRRRARLHRRTRHAAAVGPPLRREPRGRAPARRAARSARSPAATTPWTGTRAGTAWRAPTRRSSRRGGERATSAREAVEEAYARGENDEFIPPTVVASPERPPRRIADGDAVDLLQLPGRSREAADAGADRAGFAGVRPRHGPRLFTSSASRDTRRSSRCPSLSRRSSCERSWPRSGPSSGVANLRLAETEKYAHVTYFFNGGVEKAFPGEERMLVPSWRGATYDLHPQMSAEEITREAVDAIRRRAFGGARRQLRQRRHGRPHGEDPGDGRGDRNPRRLLRSTRRREP